MTGSVRGALSNERPYRDRAPANTPRMQLLARRPHAVSITACLRVRTPRRSQACADCVNLSACVALRTLQDAN
jgi:hypothetical protein